MSKNSPVIMLVDDSLMTLTSGFNTLKDTYEVLTIPSGIQLIQTLGKIIPDMILLDVVMPGMDGYDVIKMLKGQDDTADIPVIFLTGCSDPESELRGLSLGAVDYISKPFVPPLLRKRVELHLLIAEQRKQLKEYNEDLEQKVQSKAQAVLELQNAVLKTVTGLVEYHDDITGGHIERTQCYLKILLDALSGLPQYAQQITGWDDDFFLSSAQLHDVGKIAIRDVILRKPGKLTDAEYEEMKKHTIFGVDIIRKIRQSTTDNGFLQHAEIFAASHHEKWDGSGYPLGLAGEEIPLQGRLMALADVYDVLTSKRSYKDPFSHERAVDIIVAESGKHFDPSLVEIFLEHEEEFKNIVNNEDFIIK